MEHQGEQAEEELALGGLLAMHAQPPEVERVLEVVDELLHAVPVAVVLQHPGGRLRRRGVGHEQHVAHPVGQPGDGLVPSLGRPRPVVAPLQGEDPAAAARGQACEQGARGGLVLGRGLLERALHAFKGGEEPVRLACAAGVVEDEDMPYLSWNVIMKKLKNIKGFKIPVIILTKNDGMNNIKEYKDVGITDYILKPIDKDYLMNKISKYLK